MDNMNAIPVNEQTISADVFHILKEQMLIVLMNRFVGEGKSLAIPVNEIDGTGQFELQIESDVVNDVLKLKVVNRLSGAGDKKILKISIAVDGYKVKPMTKMFAKYKYQVDEPVELAPGLHVFNVYSNDPETLMQRVTKVNKTAFVNHDKRFN